LSSSWTWSPADPSTDDPYFQQMATQGQTYFQASGDGGSYRGSAPWPANSQYIQAVGGTDLQTASAGGPWSSETAWVDGGGGWGSNVSIPSWQQLTGVITSQNEGSTTLRNVPDVSAEANFDFYTCADQEACQTGWGGTSFATPMWAGFMALINQQALQNSLPVLGFINPAVYNLGLSGNYDNAFHDITSGSNGFPAVTGYDLATGWGSPNGAGLINALAGPQTPSFTLSAKPNAVTVVQGSTASSTITVNPTDGFTGSVTLSTSTLPSGVTAGFSPNPTTTTSTLTFTASSTATTGTTTITITGVSGNITQTTSVNLTVNTVNSSPAVSLSPTSLTWTKVVVGQTGSAKTVTVSNTGGGTLNISSIAVSGNFALVAAPPKTACGSTLAAGASCIVKVSFTPTQGGTVTGSLSFTDNAPGSPQKVSLSGTGVALVLSTTGLNFGTVAVGSSSASFPVTITNESSSSVTLTGITITGAKADFVITNNTCGSSIAGGGNCSVSVAFKPVTKGLLSATLKIASTGGGSPQSVSLGGNGD
jgi:subtilase family serine protease